MTPIIEARKEKAGKEADNIADPVLGESVGCPVTVAVPAPVAVGTTEKRVLDAWAVQSEVAAGGCCRFKVSSEISKYLCLDLLQLGLRLDPKNNHVRK